MDMNILARAFGPYSKFIAAVLGQALVTAQATYGHTQPWVLFATAGLAAIGVYAVPNQPGPGGPPAAS
jgi:hypothetical protein